MSLNYDKLAYIVSSDNRIAVMETLRDSPSTPSTIAKATDRDIAHISRAIQELREKGHVELKVSESVRKGRIYGLTEQGAMLAGDLSEVNTGR
ncbi:winged helix DNA-binding protein [Haloarcula sp. CBA1127]|uniref:winged helix DNA-binding protein n=1 Tax=Haloarcula sp. CBA1127 TaxID=1765055 RepID=UPI00073F93B6|nr:winged helix DNA-binding protein [Haloarcula sp. CBA1127]